MELHGDFAANAGKKLRRAARHYMIYYKTVTPTVYTSVADSGVVLTIRYLTDPRRRRGTAQAVWEAILEEFAKHPDIDFAYPTQRFYNNITEGKPGVEGVAKMGPPPELPL
jgi:small-conductance mechanosensitive channel